MASAYSDEHLAMLEAQSKTPEPVVTKPVFTSKTFWLNLLGPVFVWLATKGVNVSPDDQVVLIGGVMAAANLVVRYFTTQGIHVLPPASSIEPGVTTKDMELIVEAIKALQEQILELKNPKPPVA